MYFILIGEYNLDSKKFANIYLSVCTILFLVGTLIIEQPPEEETIVMETPMVITPGEQHLVFSPMEITAGE